MQTKGYIGYIMSLDPRYFGFVSSDDLGYQVYIPVGSPMVLFSRATGIPLAAVSINTYSEPGTAAILKRPARMSTVADFQGLFDHDHQHFELIISNLTYLGGVKIDIMKSNVAVDETDPGAVKGGLNNVNELRPLESYAVRGDQKDSRALIISAIKKADGQQLTVGEAESSSTPAGTYYYIAVTPKISNDADNAELMSLFADTYWDCVDFIVIKNRPRRMRSPALREGEIAVAAKACAAGCYSVEIASEERPARVRRARAAVETLDAGGEISPMPASEQQSYRARRARATGPILESVGGGGLIGYPASWEPESTINNSSAATVESGEIVSTQGSNTGWVYKYDVPSNQTGKLVCLGLSVAEGLTFKAPMPTSEVAEAGRLLIAELKEKGAAALSKEVKVYPEEQCVVCLDGHTEVVFCRCGHQCCCNNCSQNLTVLKCPVCRGHISALLPV